MVGFALEMAGWKNRIIRSCTRLLNFEEAALLLKVVGADEMAERGKGWIVLDTQSFGLHQLFGMLRKVAFAVSRVLVQVMVHSKVFHESRCHQ